MAKRQRKLPSWIEENLPPELANSTLFKFRIKLPVDKGIKDIDVDLLPDLDLDYELLEDQMPDIPAQVMNWAALYSEMKMRVSVQERRVKARRGQVVKLIQEEAQKNKVRLTDSQVKLIAEADKVLVEADSRLAVLQMQTGKLWHMIEALKLKAEIARSLAGFRKLERQES